MTDLIQSIKNTISQSIQFDEAHRAFVLFDTQSELARTITDAYREAIPSAQFVNFESVSTDEALALLMSHGENDFIVLIQSGSFRLNEFRLRVELFKLKIKVIEYGHLDRIPSSEIPTYLSALEYDADYYRTVGHSLKKKIDVAQTIRVETPAGVLEYQGGFEDAKLNIGDYTGMKNVGGQFPIGEVFTEPKDLSCVNGEVSLFAFGDREFRMRVQDAPFSVTIHMGEIVDVQGAPDEFHAVLDLIREEEERIGLRELGFGLNRALTRTKTLVDIGAYERMSGVHMSLGAKHTIYNKPGFSRKHSRFHVDVFVAVDRVLIENECVFQNGRYFNYPQSNSSYP